MLYRYKIRPRSPVITPLMSDTLFGHFCWALYFSKGETFLEQFLQSFEKNLPAPVLFSSAFPEGYLPRPCLPPLSRKKTETLLKNDPVAAKEPLKALIRIKKLNKISFIPLDVWQKLLNNFSEEALFNLLLSERFEDDIPLSTLEISAANVINRISGTVSEEGGLFQREKYWYSKDTVLDLYVEINDPEIMEPTDWFLTRYLPLNGYGADKSVGMGVLNITKDQNFSENSLSAEQANARMCLSLTAFDGMETYVSFYRLKTKFGKLGEIFATRSPTGGPPNPFKYPVLMYDIGTVFLCSQCLNDKPLLKNVHTDHRIRHCGVPITLPFRLTEDFAT